MKILGWEWQGHHPDHKERLAATRILRWSKNGLIGACSGAIVAVFILDAIFFAAWAPTWYLIPVFLLIAVSIRTFAVGSGPVMQRIAKILGLKKEARTVRALSIVAGLLCLVPALSFFAGGHQLQTQGATIAAATGAVSDTNKASRIESLGRQIARIEADRDAAVSGAERTIESIVNDGVPGISNADNVSIANLRSEIQAYRTKATADIAAIDTQIGSIEQEKEAAQTETAEAKTRVSPADAIFAVLGSIFGDAAIWGLTILFAFALLIEAMAFFGLGAIEGLIGRLDEAIKRVEIEAIAHKAQVEAEHARQKALAEQELVEIKLRAAEARARTDAIEAGEDPEIYDAMRAAERNLKRAEANALIAGILRKADGIAAGSVVATPDRDITSAPSLDIASTAIPEPVETPPAPVAPEPQPEPQLTDAQRWGREGGKQAAMNREAEKARKAQVFVIGPVSTLDQMKVAAE